MDDVVAETFRIAFEQRSRFDRESSSARPWLFGIALNLTRRHHRSVARAERAVSRLASSSPTPADPLLAVQDRVDAQQLTVELERELAQMPSRERDVMLMVAWDGLSPVQIAEVLGVAPETVRTRLYRARRRLRTALDHSPDAEEQDRRRKGSLLNDAEDLDREETPQ